MGAVEVEVQALLKVEDYHRALSKLETFRYISVRRANPHPSDIQYLEQVPYWKGYCYMKLDKNGHAAFFLKKCKGGVWAAKAKQLLTQLPSGTVPIKPEFEPGFPDPRR